MRTRVKICGITNIEDALAACELGADALGFVFTKSPRLIAVRDAAFIADRLPPFVKKVGVFTEATPRLVVIAGQVPLDMVQLHGEQSEEFASSLGTASVIRAVRMKDETALAMLREWETGAAYLLDAWNPTQKGGTGETFNWDLAIRAKESGKPIILAGGLTPENVGEAVRAVRPYAVDVSSGVEASPGKKDYNKIKEFMDNVRATDQNT
jgi:phosphoribosylanthranilate isomerase